MGKCFEGQPTTKLEEGGTLEFYGANIHLINNVYSISQAFHINQLKEMPTGKEEINKASFIRPKARGAYITSPSIPDLTSEFAILVQPEDPRTEDVTQRNKLLRQANNNAPKFKLFLLHTESFRLSLLTDTSFAKKQDLSSQLGYVIVLCDDNRHANINHYSSFKSEGVARSALAVELFKLSHAFDIVITLKVKLD